MQAHQSYLPFKLERYLYTFIVGNEIKSLKFNYDIIFVDNSAVSFYPNPSHGSTTSALLLLLLLQKGKNPGGSKSVCSHLL